MDGTYLNSLARFRWRPLRVTKWPFLKSEEFMVLVVAEGAYSVYSGR